MLVWESVPWTRAKANARLQTSADDTQVPRTKGRLTRHSPIDSAPGCRGNERASTPRQLQKKTQINRTITTSEIFSVNHHFRSHIHLFTIFKLSLKVFTASYTVVLGMCRTRLCDDICHIKNSDLICNAPAFLMQSVQLKPPTMTIMRIRNYN